ncbi:MAG TPA: Gfo/Idh/MocA family oxidoreductase [Firmicutes bacterium]|jgi:UDP-N-acetyl-2-amino-2-deoxyglucuronate dehydrogenase|nr:Gfo/Idh/MocA family oxidoreductase [Bacillota bacterium]
MKSVRFAIIGCGAISKAHIQVIQSLDGAEVGAAVDINEARARQVGEELGCPWYTSIEDMLADKDNAIDVVNICTASGLHMEPAISAAAAGKHVLIEKPLEVTLERCDAIIDACKKHGVLLGGVFQSRFLPANILVKKAVDNGYFGKLLLGNAEVKWFRAKEYYSTAGWRGTWRFDGGGALMNQGIHQVDLLQWMMGPVVSVKAITQRLVHETIEVEDLAVALLQFANGGVGVIEASTCIAPGYPKKLEIHGSLGGAIVQDDVITASTGIPEGPELDEAKASHGHVANFADPMAISFLGHERQISDFIHVIHHGGTLAITGEEARKSVQIVTAVYEAAKSGTTVTL